MLWAKSCERKVSNAVTGSCFFKPCNHCRNLASSSTTTSIVRCHSEMKGSPTKEIRSVWICAVLKKNPNTLEVSSTTCKMKGCVLAKNVCKLH